MRLETTQAGRPLLTGHNSGTISVRSSPRRRFAHSWHVPVLERASAVSLSHAQGSVTEACYNLNLILERGNVSPQRVNL